MGKKKAGKKKDDYWDEEFAQDADLVAGAGDEDDDVGVKKATNGFASLALEDAGVDDAEDDDGFGGLMAQISKVSKKNKKKTKEEVAPIEDEEEEDVPAAPSPKEGSDGPVVLDADDWGAFAQPAAKQKKNKKGKNTPDLSQTATPAESDDEGTDGRILTKKEKEKLKKERQKEAKKKAAQEKRAKMAEAEPAPTPKEPEETAPVPAEEPKEAVEDDEDEGEGEGEAGSKAKKNKKKKKKGAEKKEEEEAPTKSKKKGAPVAALRKLMEAQKAAEEEAARKAEEERIRAEEEQRRIEEEERLREEARLAKKEREKAKREQLKKEGKFLTKAQREAQKRAELKREQLLASGVKVAGLAASGESSPETKPTRVVYADRKRKPLKAAEDNQKAKEEEERKKREEEERKAQAEKEAAEKKAKEEAAAAAAAAAAASKVDEEDDVDDWDKDTDEEEEKEIATPKAEEKDWDESSEEEDEPATSAMDSKVANGKAATPATTAAAPAPTIAPAATKKVEESEEESSEEESSSEEDSSDYDSENDSEEELTVAQKAAIKKKEEAAERRRVRQEQAMAARSKDDLRSPICCILGHVDTGKTKLLDKIRQTNVQEGEAGGITQQIGATYFPAEAIEQKTAVLGDKKVDQLKLPGLLVIDTPGHESFTNLRSRGSSLCNIAILVVDIMHGLEPQTLESLRLLRDRKTPFIVALNKIDRLFGWKEIPNNGFQDSLSKQSQSVQREFQDRVDKTILAFAEQGLNACLYYDNKNYARNVSLVPTSAITGEGVPDMLNLLVFLTQTRMSDKLMYISELECTVLEVKVIEGLGTTIDVVLVNGWLHEGDKIVLCGLNGPIVTTVRALLTPQPMKELRIKSAYIHHKSVKAALGIKISAQDLEKAIAGSRLLVCGPDDDEEDLKEEVMSDLKSLMGSLDKTGRGVCVQASTLGSLEALLEFLKVSKIPVSGINIGPVHKKDVMRASVMLERAREYAVMLCFDVKVDKDARELADEMGIKVFEADIIYHLFDAFTKYTQDIAEQKRKDQAPQAVFPCVIKMIPQAVFNKKEPIIIGVDVLEGQMRTGTPLCVVKTDPETKKKEVVYLGKITSMEQNHKSVDIVRKGQAGGGIAIRIECAAYEMAKTYGRHFDEGDEIYSKISRTSIDVLKESFRNDLSKEEWALIVKLKKILMVE